jgi:hypothetical protein
VCRASASHIVEHQSLTSKAFPKEFLPSDILQSRLIFNWAEKEKSGFLAPELSNDEEKKYLDRSTRFKLEAQL